jgi:hypothetical protein
MVPPQIPPEVLRFLEECIDTVPQLETLLMMFDEPLRSWTPNDVSARTYISRTEASRVLEILTRRELIESPDAGGHFRIHLQNERRRALIESVARTYRANLVLIANFIHEKTPASVKEFARAFDLKKER